MKNNKTVATRWSSDCAMAVEIGKCTYCQECVDVCPSQCFIIYEGKVGILVDCGCTCCESCVEVCPEDALEIVPT